MNGVLIVDDNLVDTRIQKRVLKRCSRFGSINSVSNGLEALELFRKSKKCNNLPGFPPVLVLLDVNMPVLDGFEFVERLSEEREIDANYKIVMLTSSNAEADRRRADQFDCIDLFLVKPLTTADAIALAERYLPQSSC